MTTFDNKGGLCIKISITKQHSIHMRLQILVWSWVISL